MKRSSAAKFPNSKQLFKFCHKILTEQKGGKIHDQEVGAILDFNPSDCSHWKRGEKNVKSVFALGKLAHTLNVDQGVIFDLASGACELDEAYFEVKDRQESMKIFSDAGDITSEERIQAERNMIKFADTILEKVEFSAPPFYVPEVLPCFNFIALQPVDMLDKLSRILRKKPGQYVIQFKKGELKSQTRLSMVRDIARIVLEGERSRFPELGPLNPRVVEYEKTLLTAYLLVPIPMMHKEISKIDAKLNMIAELAASFWVPKSLVAFQLQNALVNVKQRSDLQKDESSANVQPRSTPDLRTVPTTP